MDSAGAISKKTLRLVTKNTKARNKPHHETFLNALAEVFKPGIVSEKGRFRHGSFQTRVISNTGRFKQTGFSDAGRFIHGLFQTRVVSDTGRFKDGSVQKRLHSYRYSQTVSA